MTQIKLTVSRGENFTPASLMKRYADRTPGVVYYTSYWGNARLALDGIEYQYHHWSITAENGADVVTLYFEEVKTNERV